MVISKEKNKNNQYGITDVLSVSGEEGLVNQIEHLGRSYAGTSLENYRVVHKNQVVYTKSPLKSNPYGIIKTNMGSTGIVSTLYAVYSGKENINTTIIHYYFEQNSRLNNYLKPLINKGPKNTILVSDSEALNGYVCFPQSIAEQGKIIKIFDLIERGTSIIDKKIKTLKKYKEGLLTYLVQNGHKLGKLTDYVEIQDKTYLKSSEGKDNGKYPFFINSTDESFKFTNNYLYDGGYIILNTGGDAYVRYYDGKFSAMSDCLVLKPKSNNIGIYYFLKSMQSQMSVVGFRGTGLRHLDQNWFYNLDIKVPTINEKFLAEIEEKFIILLKIMNDKLACIYCLKNYFLQNLFI